MNGGLSFRAAEASDFPKLISMWQDCFGDSPAAADNIFSNLQKPENIFVLADGREPAAMLSIREFTLASPGGKGCKAAYIYGVATSPTWQGKGLATALLSDTDGLLPQKGYACSVLVPAGESLFGFYGKRGYETAFNINKAEVVPEDIQGGEVFPLERIGAAELMRLRGSTFGGSRMFARWDEEYLEYIVHESAFYGGGTYSLGGEPAFAVCYKSGGTVFIKELGAPAGMVDAALRSIHAHFGAKKYILYLREDVKTSYKNNLLPFAMVKWYDNEVKAAMAGCIGAPAYIAHVLD